MSKTYELGFKISLPADLLKSGVTKEEIAEDIRLDLIDAFHRTSDQIQVEIIDTVEVG